MPFMPFKDTESTWNCLLTLYLKWKDKVAIDVKFTTLEKITFSVPL